MSAAALWCAGMQVDEGAHGAEAKTAGAGELPAGAVPRVMRAAAVVMGWLAYRV